TTFNLNSLIMFKYIKTLSIVVLLSFAAVYVSGSTPTQPGDSESIGIEITGVDGPELLAVAQVEPNQGSDNVNPTDESTVESEVLNADTSSDVVTSVAPSTLEEFQASANYAKFMIDNLWILI